MKYVNLILLLSLNFVSSANQPTLYHSLNTINSYWSLQKDLGTLPVYTPIRSKQTDTEIIQQHLKLVEQVLRNRKTEGLSISQKRARLLNLKHLHEYLTINTYPINNKVAWRNPVFIDDYNTFCAVGYLMKTSGYENLARAIAASQNLSYLKNIQADGLTEWIVQSGLTIDELAWIQPSYMATNHSRGLGRGVNGTVYAISGNDTSQTLYVGGLFSIADSSVSCNNIISIQYDNTNLFHNTFSAMGDGLNGVVHALKTDGPFVIAGGHFSASGTTPLNNIARWNGQSWESMGNLNGTVYCIYQYKKRIYAGGAFSFTTPSGTFQNLAVWNDSMWHPVVNHINDTVFAMCEDANRLYIGGSFTDVDTLKVNHIFAFNGEYAEKLKNGLVNTVRAITVLPNHAIAAAGPIYIAKNSLAGYAEYSEQTGWLNGVSGHFWGLDSTGHQNVCYALSDDIMVGKFQYLEGLYYSKNTAQVRANSQIQAFASTDSTVFCVYKTGKRVFFGGSFSKLQNANTAYPGGLTFNASNLAVWDKEYVTVEEISAKGNSDYFIYPNPMQSMLTIQSVRKMNRVKIYTTSGKLLYDQIPSNLELTSTISRSHFPEAGMYLIVVEDENLQQSCHKIVVR